jgi:hypothetical protein
MTIAGFRRLALLLPEVEESSHMGHPDFRVGGKIFATLGSPDAKWGMVKLTPEQQDAFVEAEPTVFKPVKGGWGLGGATNVLLAAATDKTLGPALQVAWQNTAPKKLLASAAPPKGATSSGKGRAAAKRAKRRSSAVG